MNILKNNPLANWLFIIFIIEIVIGLIFFMLLKVDFGENQVKWGQKGDMIGGILNPLISLVSMTVSILIALEINRFTKSQNDTANQYQKKRIVSEMRYSELNRFIDFINPCLEDINYKEINQLEFTILQARITKRCHRLMLHLTKNKRDAIFLPFWNSMDKMCEELEKNNHNRGAVMDSYLLVQEKFQDLIVALEVEIIGQIPN